MKNNSGFEFYDSLNVIDDTSCFTSCRLRVSFFSFFFKSYNYPLDTERDWA